MAKGQKEEQRGQTVMGPHHAFDVIGTKAAVSYTVFQRACRTGYRPVLANASEMQMKYFVETQDEANPTLAVASYAVAP